MVAICGESVENYPTIAEMAAAADAVVVGRIGGASVGNTVQGAAEDFYAEVNLRIEVDEVLRQTIADPFELSLILTAVGMPQSLEPTIAAMQKSLPRSRSSCSSERVPTSKVSTQS